MAHKLSKKKKTIQKVSIVQAPHGQQPEHGKR